MRVRVTGGSGVIGEGLIPELVRWGHRVRLFSRHARDDSRQWNGVEPFDSDVTDGQSRVGSAARCDAIIHVAGIAAEAPRT